MLPCPEHGSDCIMYWQTVDGPRHLLSTKPYRNKPWADQGLVEELQSIIFDANLYLWSQRNFIRGERYYKRAQTIIRKLEKGRQCELQLETI